MFELPELTPEYFEILVVRELRKVGLEVSALSLHRRSTQVHAEPGYLLELKGVVSRADWQRRALIGCRQQDTLIGRAEIESFREHLTEARVEAGIFRSEEHTSELQSHSNISYAVFCLKKKK